MKLLLRLEELAMFLACIGLFYLGNVSWWWYLLLFIGPDISMIGYFAGNSAGAMLYNLFHHKGFAILLVVGGIMLDIASHNNPTWIKNYDWLIYPGIVIFGHSSMDRFFGYGLKYKQGFKYTHLGVIGNKDNPIENEN